MILYTDQIYDGQFLGRFLKMLENTTFEHNFANFDISRILEM